MKKTLSAIAFIISLSAAITGCNGPKVYNSCEGSVWATSYHITYRSSRVLDDSILDVMRRVEMSLSPFADSSLVSRINRNETVETDSLFRRIFTASQTVNRLSGGCYDPTVAPLVNLWGFGYKKRNAEPRPDQIDSALQLVGISACALDGEKIRKLSPQTEFDFSSITKGYACDLIGEMLRRNGCTDYLVEIGGEVAVSGKNPQGEKWRIMIDAPVENDTAVVHQQLSVVAVTDCGVATSGNYRNYRQTSSGKAWHTISPSTGRPAVSSTLSATVIAPDAMMADALATACMAMPLEEAMRMIQEIPDTEALLVTGAGGRYEKHATPGFPAMETGAARR